MRLLFLARHAGLARNFESTLRLMAERGHEVHVALDRDYPLAREAVLERLAAAHPGLTWGRAPARDLEGWSVLGARLRRGLDYLRYFEPPYLRAEKLRARAEGDAGALLRVLGRSTARRPRARGLLRRALGALEAAAPVSRSAARLFDDHRPDAVIVSPLVELGSPQTDYVRAAKASGLPTLLCVASWDNLTNKGAIRELPDLVTVWNEAQRREAVELHGVPPERVAATGAQAYDHWFEWTPSTDRGSFARRVGLGTEGPFLLYLGSSPFIAPREASFVLDWLERLRGRPEEVLAEVGVLVRPHPQNARQWNGVDLSALGPAGVWPRGGADPVDAESKRDFFDSMHHCAAVVGVNTSALIESAIVGRPVFSLLAPEFRETQGGTLHFDHLVQGGLLHLAETFDEHAAQLAAALHEGPGDRTRNRAFIESFVRPHGLDVPATPLLVSAIEHAVAHPTPAPLDRPRNAVALRAALAPFAALAGLDARGRRAVRALIRRTVRAPALRELARRRLGAAPGTPRNGRGTLPRALLAPVVAEARAALEEPPRHDGAGTLAP